MTRFAAHIAGVPVEEAVLACLGWGGVGLYAARARLRGLRSRPLAWRSARRRARRP